MMRSAAGPDHPMADRIQGSRHQPLRQARIPEIEPGEGSGIDVVFDHITALGGWWVVRAENLVHVMRPGSTRE
jgi:hypothetical protein